MKKNKFEIGDRVAVYGYVYTPERTFYNGKKGTLTTSADKIDGGVAVQLDGLDSSVFTTCHYKQLRRLIKKKSKVYYAPINSLIRSGGLEEPQTFITANYVRVKIIK